MDMLYDYCHINYISYKDFKFMNSNISEYYNYKKCLSNNFNNSYTDVQYVHNVCSSDFKKKFFFINFDRSQNSLYNYIIACH